jgi:hypothetical protein
MDSAVASAVASSTMTLDLKSQLTVSMQKMRRFLERPINVTEGHVKLGVAASRVREEARDEEHERVQRMRHDLFMLLQQHPNSRELMRHLDLVERTLRRKGYAAVEALPVRVVGKALAQLERLVWDWSPSGLAELRSRLAVMVRNRRHEAEAEAEREAASTAAMELDIATTTHHAADVSEVDHADYEAMERSWTGTMPAGLASAIAQAKG